MKMNWTLAKGRWIQFQHWNKPTESECNGSNALQIQYRPQMLQQWSLQNASMHIRAMKPLQWSRAMAIGHDQLDIFPVKSHWQTRWPTITMAAKMKARHSRSDKSAGSKQIEEFVSEIITWSLSWRVSIAHNTWAHQESTKVNGASNEVAMTPWFYEVPQ
jgi:hypothetical protein